MAVGIPSPSSPEPGAGLKEAWSEIERRDSESRAGWCRGQTGAGWAGSRPEGRGGWRNGRNQKMRLARPGRGRRQRGAEAGGGKRRRG